MKAFGIRQSPPNKRENSNDIRRTVINQEYMRITNKKMIIISAIILIIVVSGLAVFFSGRIDRKIRLQMDMGQKYLADLQYEQAIAAFKGVLEIDPDNKGAMDAVIRTYFDWAEQCIEAGETDKAIRILEEGVDYTGDPQISSRLAELKTSLEKKASEEVLPEDEAIQEITDTTEYIKTEYGDLIQMLDDYNKEFYRVGSRGNGDWREVFLTFDKVKEAYDPIITRLEEYIKFSNANNIDTSEEVEVGRNFS